MGGRDRRSSPCSQEKGEDKLTSMRFTRLCCGKGTPGTTPACTTTSPWLGTVREKGSATRKALSSAESPVIQRSGFYREARQYKLVEALNAQGYSHVPGSRCG